MKLETKRNGRGIAPTNQETQVRLPAMKIATAKFKIVGETALIIQRFTDEAREKILGKQTGEADSGREKKNPLAEYKSSGYRDADGFLFPSVCFKAAAVACANDIGQKQTEMRRAIHVRNEFVRIDCPPLKTFTEYDEKHRAELKWEHERGCSMRCDRVRLPNGSPDFRFRSFFPVWSMTIEVDFNQSIISLDQLTMLFTVAGFGNGIGEWRPGSKESKTGTFGRFRLG